MRHFIAAVSLSLIASAPKCLAYNRAPFGTAHAPALWQFVPMNNDNNNNSRGNTTTYSHFRHVTFFELLRKDDNFISELAAFYETSAAKWRRKRQVVCSTSCCCCCLCFPAFYFSLATLLNPLPLSFCLAAACRKCTRKCARISGLAYFSKLHLHNKNLPAPSSRLVKTHQQLQMAKSN